MKRLFALLGLILFCIGVGEGMHGIRKGFTIRRLQPLERKAIVIWKEEAESALDQKFYFLGRGRQCFAFGSEDGKYVLKFPRTDIYRIPLWARALPVRARREKICAERNKTEARLLESFRLSLNELGEQTGMIAIHWGQTSGKGKKLTLVDSLGCTFHLPREKSSFVLQYKVPLLVPQLLAALRKGDREEGSRIVEALVQVIAERGRKGVLNRDGAFLRNYGYDGQKAYQIDIGSFFQDKSLKEEEAFKLSVEGSMHPIREWLGKEDPEMLQFLEQRLLPF